MAGTREDVQQVLGRRIRAYRKLAGLTQREVALQAEIDFRYFGGIERGRKNVTIETLRRIAGVLGVEAFELLVPLGEEVTRNGPAELDRILALLERASTDQQEAVLGVLESFAPYRASRAGSRRKPPAGGARKR